MEDAADDDNDDIIEVNPNATDNKENEDDDDNIQEIDDWGKCHFYHKLEVFLNLPLDVYLAYWMSVCSPCLPLSKKYFTKLNSTVRNKEQELSTLSSVHW